MIFVALSASAISAARRSELTRSDLPSGPNASGDTRGTTWRSISSMMSSLSIRSTLPVSCWSTPLMMPTGTARTAFVIAALSELCVRPSRMTCDTREDARIARSSVAGSVGPVPSLLEIGIPRSAESSWSWWPIPCTRTTLMARLLRTAMSTRRLPKFSSATIEPSTAITKICPWKRGTYWRMPRRSVGLIVVVWADCGAAGGVCPFSLVIGGLAFSWKRPRTSRDLYGGACAAKAPRRPSAHAQGPGPRRPFADNGDAVRARLERAGGDSEQGGALAGAREQVAAEALEVGHDHDLALALVKVSPRQLPLVVGERVGEPDLVVDPGDGHGRRRHRGDRQGQERGLDKGPP